MNKINYVVFTLDFQKRAVREESLVSESSNYTSESDAISIHEHYEVAAVVPLFRTGTMEVCNKELLFSTCPKCTCVKLNL